MQHVLSWRDSQGFQLHFYVCHLGDTSVQHCVRGFLYGGYQTGLVVVLHRFLLSSMGPIRSLFIQAEWRFLIIGL